MCGETFVNENTSINDNRLKKDNNGVECESIKKIFRLEVPIQLFRFLKIRNRRVCSENRPRNRFV